MDGSLVEEGSAGADPAALRPSISTEWASQEVFDCAEVIRGFDELPSEVRTASIARVDSRLFGRDALADLIAQTPPPGCESGWSERVLRREASLKPHVGKFLFCVLIRLPGVRYTVEIDPLERSVVYWEWQAV